MDGVRQRLCKFKASFLRRPESLKPEFRPALPEEIVSPCRKMLPCANTCSTC